MLPERFGNPNVEKGLKGIDPTITKMIGSPGTHLVGGAVSLDASTRNLGDLVDRHVERSDRAIGAINRDSESQGFKRGWGVWDSNIQSVRRLIASSSESNVQLIASSGCRIVIGPSRFIDRGHVVFWIKLVEALVFASDKQLVLGHDLSSVGARKSNGDVRVCPQT